MFLLLILNRRLFADLIYFQRSKSEELAKAKSKMTPNDATKVLLFLS